MTTYAVKTTWHPHYVKIKATAVLEISGNHFLLVVGQFDSIYNFWPKMLDGVSTNLSYPSYKVVYKVVRGEAFLRGKLLTRSSVRSHIQLTQSRCLAWCSPVAAKSTTGSARHISDTGGSVVARILYS